MLREEAILLLAFAGPDAVFSSFWTISCPAWTNSCPRSPRRSELRNKLLFKWTNGHDLCQKVRHSRGYASKAEPYCFQTWRSTGFTRQLLDRICVISEDISIVKSHNGHACAPNFWQKRFSDEILRPTFAFSLVCTTKLSVILEETRLGMGLLGRAFSDKKGDGGQWKKQRIHAGKNTSSKRLCWSYLWPIRPADEIDNAKVSGASSPEKPKEESPTKTLLPSSQFPLSFTTGSSQVTILYFH